MSIQVATALAALLAFADTNPEPPRDAKKELAKLQGVWRREFPEDKRKPPLGPLIEQPRQTLTLEGTEGTLAVYIPTPQGLLLRQKFTLAIDVSKHPMHLDWGDSRGIYRLSGDSLTICRSDRGKDRPTSFQPTSPKEEVSVWKRVKR